MSQPPDTWAREMRALQDQIEQLTLGLATANSNLFLVRGQRHGYASLLMNAREVIEQHWRPHNEASRAACERILVRLGDRNAAALEVVAGAAP
jgi:hypothetical protein